MTNGLRLGLLSAAVAMAGFGTWAHQARGAEIAKLPGNAPVTVTQDDRFFTLDNGIVKVVINKRTGGPQQLIYKGIDLAGHDHELGEAEAEARQMLGLKGGDRVKF